MSASDILCLSLSIAWLVLGSVVPMWAVTDAVRLPNSAWARSGRDKRIWVVLPPVATLVCGVGGLVVAWSYYKYVRPEVLAEMNRAAPRTF